jgi:hypothetical protein
LLAEVRDARDVSAPRPRAEYMIALIARQADQCVRSLPQLRGKGSPKKSRKSAVCF